MPAILKNLILQKSFKMASPGVILLPRLLRNLGLIKLVLHNNMRKGAH